MRDQKSDGKPKQKDDATRGWLQPRRSMYMLGTLQDRGRGCVRCVIVSPAPHRGAGPSLRRGGIRVPLNLSCWIVCLKQIKTNGQSRAAKELRRCDKHSAPHASD